jgi:hypothetical protein
VGAGDVMKIPELLKKELSEMSEEELRTAHDMLVDLESHIEVELYLRDGPEERVERADGT